MPTKMEHFPRLNRRTTYSKQSRYRKYKAEIQEDCRKRCVYCDIHEQETGGSDNMTLDHFRPRKKYPALENEPTNLVWACNPCNQFKGDDWPAYGLKGDPTINGGSGYIDPFAVDRNEYFQVEDNGSLTPLKPPAKYMIEGLLLNRHYLRYIRKRRDFIYQALFRLEKRFREEIHSFERVLKDPQITTDEKVRWAEEKKDLENFLELVVLLDDMLSYR